MRTKHLDVRAAAIAAALALAVGAPSLARAQDAAAAMTDEARRLYDEARQAKESGDHATCVAKLRAAWALVQHRQVAGLLGECELRTGAHRDAAEHLAHYLDHAGDASPEATEAVRKLYDEARAEVAVVTVRASVDGADRKVDGRPLAPGELRVFLAPGEHVFAASKPGAGAAEKKLFVSAGQEREIVLELEAGAAGGAAAPPGPYRGPAPPPDVTEDAGPSIVPGIILASAGVVGVGVGIGLVAAAGSAGDDADAIAAAIDAKDATCQPVTPGFAVDCQRVVDAAEREDVLGVAGTVSLIGGGLLLAGGMTWIVYAVTSGGDGEGVGEGSDTAGGGEKRRGLQDARRVAPRPRVAIVPTGGPGGGGLNVRGTFW